MKSQVPEKRLENRAKHVVLSGGSKGLGLYISQQLLLAGYTVSAFSRTKTEEVAKLEEDFAERYYFAQADSANSNEVETFFGQAIKKLGAVYGVINNSAVAVDGVFATLPEVEIEKMLSVNLGGAFCLTRLCLRDMLVSKQAGRILFISSVAAKTGLKGLAVYSATKAAVEGMTRSLAREVGSRQITVNAVAPGYMLTDISKGLSDEQREQIIRRTPLGRLTEFEDVFAVVELLLSERGKFITGQTIAVDGGLSI